MKYKHIGPRTTVEGTKRNKTKKKKNGQSDRGNKLFSIVVYFATPEYREQQPQNYNVYTLEFSEAYAQINC